MSRLPFCGQPRPVLELVHVEFAFKVGDALREACLRIVNGAVVNRGTDLFKDVVEEQPGREIAEGLEVLFEVAFEGGDGVGTGWSGEFDRMAISLRDYGKEALAIRSLRPVSP